MVLSAGGWPGRSDAFQDPQDDEAIGLRGGVEDRLQFVVAQVLGALDQDDERVAVTGDRADRLPDLRRLAAQPLRRAPPSSLRVLSRQRLRW